MPEAKDSTVEKLPEGWKKVKLGKISDFFTAASKSRYIVDYGKYVVVDMGAISSDGKLIKNKKTDIPMDLLEYGDLIMPKDDIGGGNIIGKVAFIDYNEKYVLGDHVFRIKIKEIGDSKYFYYFINSKRFNTKIKRLVTGTAQLGIKREEVKKLEVIAPKNIEEQRKIAEILETTDNAIEKTDAIIEKYKRIKQGLMQDLLTKGVDENGQIRSEETHRFKASPLGRIPEEWEVVRLGEVLEYKQPTKYIVKTENYDERVGIPVLTPGKTFILGYTDEKDGIFKDFPVIIFDDFTTKSKYITFPFKVKSSALKILKVRDNKNNLYFLYNTMQILNFKPGSEHKRFWISEYSKLKISLPPLPEQHRIASILSQIDETIEKEEKYKEKLERIKRGLMEDLLTGKVRINHMIGENNADGAQKEALA